MAKRPYDSRYWRETIRPRILKRDSHRCQLAYPNICQTKATHVDHIIPWQQGGPWYDDWNLRAACPPCNTHRQWAPDPTNTTPSRNW